MLCSHRSSCIDLPVAFFYCHVEGFPSCFHHICQGGYVVLNCIGFYGAERNICHNQVDELRGWGKSETFKKVGDSTVYRTDESEE